MAISKHSASISESLENRADDAAREFGGEPIERVDVLTEERAAGSVTLAVFDTS